MSRQAAAFPARISRASRHDAQIIVGMTLLLTVMGLVMVLSASGVSTRSSPYRLLTTQAVAAGLGVAAMLVLSRFPVRVLRRLSWPAFLLTLVLLVLVLTPLGVEVNGARRWLGLGPVTFQPSELAKFTSVLWSAHIVDAKRRLLHDWKHLAIPYLVGNGLFIALVLLEKDLGTAAVLMLITLATLFIAGVELRKLLVVLGGVSVVVIIAALISPNRMVRLMSWANRACDDGMDLCHQNLQGQYALASGGLWGVGMGQSRQKWHWIPEAHTDFIFAVIGEEMGLIGSLFFLLIFAFLAVSIHRIAQRSTSVFARCFCTVTLIWLIAQAVLNIAMVAGLVPVTGVPLTFISFGGSSLATSLAAIGVVLAVARDNGRQPDPQLQASKETGAA